MRIHDLLRYHRGQGRLDKRQACSYKTLPGDSSSLTYNYHLSGYSLGDSGLTLDENMDLH